MTTALRVVRPHHAVDSQRTEQVLPRELRLAALRRGANRRPQQVIPRTAIHRARAGIVLHRQPERELHPVRRPLHPLQFLFAGQVSAIQSRLHAEQILYRDLLLSRLSSRRALLRKQRQYPLVKPQKLTCHRHPGKHGRHGLGHRGEVVRRPAIVGIENRVHDGIAMPDHQQAVDTQMLLPRLVDDRRQRLRIDALRLRSRRAPFIAGPVRGSATDRGQQQSAADGTQHHPAIISARHRRLHGINHLRANNLAIPRSPCPAREPRPLFPTPTPTPNPRSSSPVFLVTFLRLQSIPL